MVRAAKYQPLFWDKTDLGIDDDSQIGLRGSPTIVSKVWAPPARQRGTTQVIDGSDPDKAAAELADMLLKRAEYVSNG
jgi:electron transfer flavoprotein beta subunit